MSNCQAKVKNECYESKTVWS